MKTAAGGGDANRAAPGAASVRREAVGILVQLLAPMLPHLAEEMWAAMGHETLLADTPWPEANPVLIRDDTVTVAVQVNGKRRTEIVIAKDLDKSEVEKLALNEEAIIRALGGAAPKKVIVVPGRIVNVVA